jgi:hypothetical protein
MFRIIPIIEMIEAILYYFPSPTTARSFLTEGNHFVRFVENNKLSSPVCEMKGSLKFSVQAYRASGGANKGYI